MNYPINRTDPSGHCIVQWSGEVRMGQAPYGTSGICPHTETQGIEAEYDVTAVSNTPGYGTTPTEAAVWGTVGLGIFLLPEIAAGYSALELALYSGSAGCLTNPVCAAWIFGVENQAANPANTSVSQCISNPRNVAQYENYKDWLRSQMGKPFVTDPRLRSLMDVIYRPGARIGSGSTAAAVREELATGLPVGGRWHSQKAGDYIIVVQKSFYPKVENEI